MSKYGAPEEVVELVDIPEPDAPKADELLVAVEYAPINNSALLKIKGRYPLKLPLHDRLDARALAIGLGQQPELGRPDWERMFCYACSCETGDDTW